MSVDHNNILIELNKAVKTVSFYPQGHPILETALQAVLDIFMQALSEKGNIIWTVNNKGIFEGSTQLAPSNTAITKLAKDLFARKLKQITFTKSITSNDIYAFLSILKMTAQDVHASGGAEKMFKSMKIVGIVPNEIHYDELVEHASTAPEEAQKEEDAVQPHEEAQASEEVEEIVLDEGEEEIEEIQPHKPATEELNFQQLLRRIQVEDDLISYRDIAVRLREKADALIKNKRFEMAFPALRVYVEHTLPTSHLEPTFRTVAGEHLSALMTREVVSYLIKRIIETDDDFEKQIIKILFSKTDKEGMNVLLNSIIEMDNAHDRRILFDIVKDLGERLRMGIEIKLKDSRWFAVRQMVTLLGELGGSQSVEPLASVFSHEDIRVRKEVLKSLGRIHDKKSIDLLLTALNDEDGHSAAQAIISLASLKAKEAIHKLGEFSQDLKDKRNDDKLDLCKEAIRGLGAIGNEIGIPYLKKIVNKKVMFNKKQNDEYRHLAVQNLGRIGGEDVMAFIEKVGQDAEGEILHACKRILEGKH